MNNLKGQTALITGASSGIGEAIARKLAAEGVNLVLVARSQDKLTKLSNELIEQNAIRSITLAADLSKPRCGASILNQVNSHGISVDILINNAGFGTYGLFEAISPETEQDEIMVNVAAVVDMTHAFLPGMLQRQKGKILNIASTSSFQPVPYMATYAASKAFILSFSEALWAEYYKRKIHVVALCPGAVETGFIDALGNKSIRQTPIFSTTISPRQVANHALKALLLEKKPTHIIGLKNWLMAYSVRFSPRTLVALIGEKMLRP